MLWKYCKTQTTPVSTYSQSPTTQTQRTLTSPHHGPAAHHRAPIRTPDCYLAERTLDGRDTVRARARADLAEEALEVVLLEPLRRILDALRGDRGRHACRGRA